MAGNNKQLTDEEIKAAMKKAQDDVRNNPWKYQIVVDGNGNYAASRKQKDDTRVTYTQYSADENTSLQTLTKEDIKHNAAESKTLHTVYDTNEENGKEVVYPASQTIGHGTIKNGVMKTQTHVVENERNYDAETGKHSTKSTTVEKEQTTLDVNKGTLHSVITDENGKISKTSASHNDAEKIQQLRGADKPKTAKAVKPIVQTQIKTMPQKDNSR